MSGTGTRVDRSAVARTALILFSVALLLAVAGAVAPAAVAAQEDSGLSAEVTDETLFGTSATEVTVYHDLESGEELQVEVVGHGSETVVSDGEPGDVAIRTGFLFKGAQYPVVVKATVDGETYRATLRDAGEEVDFESVGDGPAEGEFGSVEASVSQEALFGGAKSVSFAYDAPEDATVTLQAADRTREVDGGTGQATLWVGSLFFGESYPIDVSASIQDGETVEGTIESADDRFVYEGGEASANYDVDVDADDVETNETLTVTGTVTNTGDAAGSQDVTVSVADQSTTETVDLEPGDSQTVTLDWQTSEADVGEHTATVESEDDSASITVEVTDAGEPEPPGGITVGDFTAYGQEGTIHLPDADEAQQNIDIPECDEDTPVDNSGEDKEWSDECFVIDATVDDDGSWEAAPEDITFPTITDNNPPSVSDSAEITMETPNGLSGEIDANDGTFTMEGDFEIVATIDSPLGTDTCSAETTIDASTDDGEALDVDVDADEATAAIGSNDFSVSALGGDDCSSLVQQAANNAYGLPVEDGTTFDLDLWFDGEFTEDGTEPQPDPAEFDVSIDGSNAPVTEGETLTVDATVENVGDEAGEQDVTLSIDGEAVATETVSLDGGEDASVSFEWQTEAGDAGDHEVTVASEDSSDSVTVTVEPAVQLESITLDLDDELEVDESTDATVTATYDDGSTVDVTDDATITADGDAVSVNGSTVTADAAGDATVTAEYEGETDSASITVLEPAFFAVDVSAPADVTEGETLTVDATVENTGDVAGEQTVTLSVDGEAVASETVSLDGGNATSVAFDWQTESGDAGDHDVTVASEDDSATTTATVEPARQLESITLDLPDELVVGETADATVTANYDDDSTETVTDDASITAEGGVSVDSSTVTADAAGDATVTAEYEGETDSASVTVLEPAFFAVDVSAPAEVTEGEDVTVDATVENTGDVEDTQTVTLSIADESTTEDVTLGADDNATVSLVWETETGDEGSYDATVESADDSASTTVDVVAPEPGEIAGTVTDADGNSIADATVTVGDQETTTDENGDYAVAVEPGEYTVSVEADGYVGDSTDVTVASGETAEANFELASEGGLITGTVVDLPDHNAVEGATVSAGGAQTATDANGSFELGVAAGTYDVTVDAEGYVSQTIDGVTVEADSTADVGTVRLDPELDRIELSVDDQLEVGDEVEATVMAISTNGVSQDVTSMAEITSDDTAVVTVDNGIISAAGAGNATVTATFEGETDAVDVTVSGDAFEPAAATATVESGYINIGSVPEEFEEPGYIEFPECPDGEPVNESGECITLEANLDHDNNTYTVTSDRVNFPTLDVYSTTLGSAIDANVSAPEGATGDVDLEEGSMTFESELRADLPALAGPGQECYLPLNIQDATTGQSGDLTGTPIDLDSQDATLVDNEFAVESSAGDGALCGAVDSELDLPQPSGENQLVMDVVFEYHDEKFPDDGNGEPEPEPEPANFSATIDDAPETVEGGDDVTVTATVENTGEEEGTQEVTLADFDGNVVDSEEVTLAGGDSTTVELTWTTPADAEGTGDVTVSTDNSSDAATVEITQPEPAVTSFSAYAQEGEIIISEEGADDPIIVPACDQKEPQDPDDYYDENGTVEWEDECFVINGTIDDDGTWSAGPDDVYVPIITTHDPITTNVTLTADNGLSGDVDLDTGELTIQGDLSITAEAVGCQTTTTLDATTGTSGNLTGSPLDASSGTANGTVVDNTLTVPAMEPATSICGIADSSYNLPSLEEGANEFTMDVWVELGEA